MALQNYWHTHESPTFPQTGIMATGMGIVLNISTWNFQAVHKLHQSIFSILEHLALCNAGGTWIMNPWSHSCHYEYASMMMVIQVNVRNGASKDGPQLFLKASMKAKSAKIITGTPIDRVQMVQHMCHGLWRSLRELDHVQPTYFLGVHLSLQRHYAIRPEEVQVQVRRPSVELTCSSGSSDWLFLARQAFGPKHMQALH